MDEHEIDGTGALLRPDEEIMLTVLLDSLDSMYDKDKFISDVKSGFFKPSDVMRDPSLLEKYTKRDAEEYF
jgi:hypothetical protein